MIAPATFDRISTYCEGPWFWLMPVLIALYAAGLLWLFVVLKRNGASPCSIFMPRPEHLRGAIWPVFFLFAVLTADRFYGGTLTDVYRTPIGTIVVLFSPACSVFG